MKKYIIWALVIGVLVYIWYTYYRKPSSTGSGRPSNEQSTNLADWGNSDPYDDGTHGQHAVIEWSDAGTPPYKCNGTYYPDGSTTPLPNTNYTDYDQQPALIWIGSMNKYMINPCKMTEALSLIVDYRENKLN